MTRHNTQHHAGMVLGVIYLCLAFWCATSVADAKRMTSDLTCEPTDQALVYHCTIRLMQRQDNKPIQDAEFVMNTSMPSMPMAHHMPPVKGQPGKEPGIYHGVFHFEMAGEWAIDVQTQKPFRDIMRHKIIVHKPGGSTSTSHHKHSK